MVWVYTAVAVGLLGILLEIGRSYSKVSKRLILEQKALYREIGNHRNSIGVLQRDKKTGDDSAARLAMEKAEVSKELNWQRQNLDDLLRRDVGTRLGNPKIERDDKDKK